MRQTRGFPFQLDFCVVLNAVLKSAATRTVLLCFYVPKRRESSEGRHQRTPRRRSTGVPPAVRRRSAGGPSAFRTRSAPVPHRCRTGAAPVPHWCRTLPSTARSMMVGRVFLVLTGACQFGHGVGGFTTNFIHSHWFRTGSAPVPHRCRRSSAANPHGHLQTARKAKKNWVFFPSFLVFLCFWGCFLCFLGGVFARRRRAAHLPAFRTRSPLCSTLAPHLCRTCAALVPHLCRTCAALVPHLCRTTPPVEVYDLGTTGTCVVENSRGSSSR